MFLTWPITVISPTKKWSGSQLVESKTREMKSGISGIYLWGCWFSESLFTIPRYHPSCRCHPTYQTLRVCLPMHHSSRTHYMWQQCHFINPWNICPRMPTFPPQSFEQLLLNFPNSARYFTSQEERSNWISLSLMYVTCIRDSKNL
jgi:hypothetical protein